MRSIEEIYNSLVAAKDSDPVLSPLLTSSSATAIWKAIFYVVSATIWIHEGLFEVFKSEVTEIANNAYAGTVPWYHRMCLSFQYGHSVEILQDGKVGYAIIDQSAQIIKYAAIVETGNILQVKVAKDGLQELSASEEAAFIAYLNHIKFAGTKTAVVNVPADLIILDIVIYYNPQLISATGEDLSMPGTYPVVDAVDLYLSSILFGGTLVKTHLNDYIQAATGVCDLNMTQLQAKQHLGAYTIVSNNVYNSFSGKIQVDTLNITYTPCNII